MIRVVEFLKNGFDTFFDIIRGIGSVLYSLITVLGKCVSFMGTVIGHLPLYVSVPVGFLVIVCVLYKILGREGQD
jgi:hypothetical protein